MGSKKYPTIEEKRAYRRKDLDRIAEAIGPYATVRATQNAMLAGPCVACISASERTYTTLDAPLPPFDACPHPDQCAVFYRLEYDPDIDYRYPAAPC